jgi:hypothetical protein
MPSEPRTLAHAWAQAAACAEQASRASSNERREMFLRLRDSWILVANELQFIDGVKHARRIQGRKRLRAILAANAH